MPTRRNFSLNVGFGRNNALKGDEVQYRKSDLIVNSIHTETSCAYLSKLIDSKSNIFEFVHWKETILPLVFPNTYFPVLLYTAKTDNLFSG